MKPTDYLLGMALAYMVIKELFKLVREKKESPSEMIRVTDESELQYRQSMMAQHDKITECLIDVSKNLAGIATVGKSTDEKCEKIKENTIIIKDRISN